MLENISLEALLPVVGGGIGFVFRQFAEATRRQFEIAKERVAASDDSRDKAAQRTGGTNMRRGIYALIALFFLSIVIAGFADVPVVVEVERKVGFLFWRHTEIFFETIRGVLFPVEIRQAFLALLGFYLGQGVK